MKFLVIIFLSTFFLRFYHISSKPLGLYWDELDTAYQSYSLLHTGRDYFGNLFPAHLQAFADYRSSLYMYLSVPLVKIFGPTPIAIRSVSAIFSLITILLSYIFAAKVLKLGKYSFILPAVLSFAPWALVQGRIAAESQLLLPLVFLGLIALNASRYTLLSFSLSLCLWAYPTAKIFFPIFFLLMLYLFIQKKSRIALFVFLLVSFLPVYETFSKPIGRRFAELSIFNDPTIAKKVETQRQLSYLSSGVTFQPGLNPGIVDKIIYNKYTLLGQKLVSNYFTSISTGFLFQTGDPNLRHNINLPNTGQFYLIDLWPFVLGLVFVLSRINSTRYKLLAISLILSPIPSIFTSDGASHAPRLIYLFPVVSIFISIGLVAVLKSKFIKYVYLLILIPSILLSVQYFFTTYQSVSAADFDHGFLQSVREGIASKSSYDRVVFDMYNESALMAYLVASQYPPAKFQKSFPLPSETIFNGVEGYKFENMLFLYPGTRDWNKIKLPGNSLIFSSALQPNAVSVSGARIIQNPDSTPAIVVFSQSN